MRSDSRPGGSQRPTSWPKRFLLVFSGLGLFALGLVVGETLLSVLRIGDDTLFEDPFISVSGSALFGRRKPVGGPEVYATRVGKLKFFNPQQFPVDKPVGGFRVFTLGGSTTQGQPYDHRVAFAAWLQLYLRAADPSRPWEVINAGALSYASYRIVALIKELLLYEPDLFVVYTGHNEFLEERTYSALIHQPEWCQRLRLWLDGRRLYGLLATRLANTLRNS